MLQLQSFFVVTCLMFIFSFSGQNVNYPQVSGQVCTAVVSQLNKPLQ